MEINYSGDGRYDVHSRVLIFNQTSQDKAQQINTSIDDLLKNYKIKVNVQSIPKKTYGCEMYR